VTTPTPRRVLAFVIVARLALPAFTGSIDLYLRADTP